MRCPQPGILAPVPAVSRYLTIIGSPGAARRATPADVRIWLRGNDADARFRFTRPVSGAYFRCPPQAAGRVDLSLLGP